MATATFKFTEADIQSLSSQIKQAQSHEAVPSGIVNEFCKIWPDIDKGLTLLEDIVGKIPGWGAVAKAAIAIVIAVGEAASKALCPSGASSVKH
jgi:hypothetical protein